MYLRDVRGDPDGPRLVCLPGAAASPVPFRAWADAFAGRYHLQVADPWALYLATEGRANATLADTARLIAPEVADGPPAVLVGHSRGALLAYEVAQQLHDAGRGGAVQAVVAMAHRAPTSPPLMPVAGAPDGTLIEFLHEAGGTDEAAFDDPELLQLILARLRAELTTSEGYRSPWPAPLPADLYLYLGCDDASVPTAEADAWRKCVDGAFTHRVFPGGHFFPFAESPGLVHEALADDFPSLRR